MAEVVLEDVTKIYPGNEVPAVRDASLYVRDQEFVVLVGPSGCGKSTTLRMIAGLEEITKGTITIDGRVVNDVPPKDRDIAMVFQNYALYPHMTVYKNLAFGLRLRKFPRKEIDERVQEAARVLNIGHLLDRKPKALSGGERQRVAVGRAIVRKPKVFLFDEPLSNLDAKLRVEMRAELTKLHRRLSTTIIYVTHDQIEAMTLGQRICIINQGIIQQVDEPMKVYNYPANRFVAGFIGTPPMNFIDGRLTSGEGKIFFEDAGLRVPLREEFYEALEPHLGKRVTFGIRPEDVHDPTQVLEGLVHFRARARINMVEPLGDEMLLYLTTGTNNFVGKVGSYKSFRVGDEMEVGFDLRKVHIFDSEDGRNLSLKVLAVAE